MIDRQMVEERLNWVAQWLEELPPLERLVAATHANNILFEGGSGIIATIATIRREAAKQLCPYGGGGMPRKELALAAGMTVAQVNRLLDDPQMREAA